MELSRYQQAWSKFYFQLSDVGQRWQYWEALNVNNISSRAQFPENLTMINDVICNLCKIASS